MISKNKLGTVKLLVASAGGGVETDGIGGETNEEPEVKTVDSLEEALKDLVNQQGEENVYVEVPKLDLSKIVVPNEEIHNNCYEQWKDCERSQEGFF